MIRYMGGLGQSSDPALPSLRQGGPAARPRPDRAGHARRPPRPVSATPRSPARGRDRDPGLGRQPRRSQDRDERRRLDPRRRLGAVPAADVRDAVVPGLRLGPQHVQPGRRRGDDRRSPAASTSRAASPTWTTTPGSLKVELGPTRPVTLQWATYYDAADMAGQSRLYGGIHIQADDFNGRMIGSAVRQGRVGARAAVLRRAGRVDEAVTGRRPRRSAAGVLVVGAAIVVAAVGGSALGVGCRRQADARRVALGAAAVRRRDGDVGHRPHLRRATSRTPSGAGSPSSTATTTAGPTCTSPAASEPAALYRNESPSAARSGSTQVADPAADLDRRHRRLPARHRRRRHVDLASCATGENVAPPRARRLPVRARQRGLGVRRRRRGSRRRSARPGRDRPACRRSRSATTSLDAETGESDHLCADERAGPADPDRPTLRRRRSPLTPGWCALSMLFSDWDRLRPARPPDQQRPPLLRRERRPGAALADRARRAAAPVHRRRRLGAAPG